MKKTVLVSLIMVFAYSITNAQMKMTSDGNFAVATTPTPWTYTKFKVDFSSTNYYSAYHYNYAFYSANKPPTSIILRAFGIFASSYPTTQSNNIYNWGVYGQAGNGINGLSYGVTGALVGSAGAWGAGIYGAAQGNGFFNTSGNYAGFFAGDVKSTGIMYANAFTLNSDSRLKKNVSALTATSFNKISQLNAVEYQYKTRQELMADGTIPTDTALVSEKDYINKVRYGYIAQDLQQIFPELVYEGDDGFLAVDYIGLIPLMIEEIKQQNATITDLQKQINTCCTKGSTQKTTGQDSTIRNNTNDNYDKAILYQNTPNPFSRETQIKCFIPDKAMVSDIYIYDMQGTQLKKIQINGKGDESITIQSSELKAGMYMYTLIIDGKEIDTKKMILTD